MGYQQDQLDKANQGVQDYLDNNLPKVDEAIKKTKDYFGNLDTSRALNTQDVLGQVAGRYGIDPNIGAAGADVASAQEAGIQRRRDAALGQMRMARVGDQYNKLFNQKYDEYISAGQTQRNAEAAARAWTAQITGEGNAADLAQGNRNYQEQKQAIANQFGLMTNDLNQAPQNPYEAALYRSLFGLGTTVAGYAIINGKKVPVNSSGQPVNSTTSYPQGGNAELNLDGGYS